MGTAKQKGNRGERQMRDLFRRYIDPNCKRQLMSGADSWNPGDLRFSYKTGFNFIVEVKNQERLNVWDSWKQVTEECSGPADVPVLAFTRNNHDMLVAMKAEQWIDLMEELHEYRQRAEQEDTKTCEHSSEIWRLRTAIKHIKDYLK